MRDNYTPRILEFSNSTLANLHSFFFQRDQDNSSTDLLPGEKHTLRGIIVADPLCEEALLLTQRELDNSSYSPVLVIKGIMPELEDLDDVARLHNNFNAMPLEKKSPGNVEFPKTHAILHALAESLKTRPFSIPDASYQEIVFRDPLDIRYSSKNLHVDYPACASPPDYTMLFGCISNPNVLTELYRSQQLLRSLTSEEISSLKQRRFYSDRDDVGPISLMNVIDDVILLNYQKEIFIAAQEEDYVAVQALQKLENALEAMEQSPPEFSLSISTGDIVLFDNLRYQHRARVLSPATALDERVIIRVLRNRDYPGPSFQ